MTKKEKKLLNRVLISTAVFIPIYVSDLIFGLSGIIGGKFGFLLPFFLYLGVYLYIGFDVVVSAVKNIRNGQVFDEKFLMAVASLGALALAFISGIRGVKAEGYEEACAVMILYKLGNFFELYASGKSRRSIAELMKLRPDTATVLRNGEAITVSPEEVKIGEIVLVLPGEKIALDGKVVFGATSIDCKALTGEALPLEVEVGDEVLSGSVNLTSEIRIEVKSEFKNSTVQKILDLVENAVSKKSKTENFISKFAKYYTPAVVTSALLLALVPSIITKNPAEWIYRALNFLVVSCPCALVISVPLAFVSGIGVASKCGILVKGGASLELYNKANTFAFDKTGTLTEGNFEVAKVFPKEREEEILSLAVTAEKYSLHPIAISIKNKFKGETEDYSVSNVSGKGIIAKKGDDEILCGNKELMKSFGVRFKEAEEVGTVVYVARGREFIGYIVVSDKVKAEAKEVVESLSAENCKTVMLTGDGEKVASQVAEKLGLSTYRAGLLPQDKVKEVENLIKDAGKGKVCFVGDGINDAPVIATADIGVAMGGLGSDSAIEASDIVLMKDDLKSLLRLKKISKKTVAIVKENVYGSIGVKFLILVLSALGLAGMWIAILGDVGVATVAILNSMRIANCRKTLDKT